MIEAITIADRIAYYSKMSIRISFLVTLQVKPVTLLSKKRDSVMDVILRIVRNFS